MRRLYWGTRRTRSDGHGRHVFALGAQTGYWPCLNAVFIGATLGSWIYEVWWRLG